MSKIIAFQGSKGAYSDLACREVFPEAKTLPCETFYKAFLAVQNQDADLAMIPVDNTLAGRVADVHRLMPESGLHIIGETFQPIRHTLMGIKGSKIENIKHVHSHIHALPQCQKIINDLNLSEHVSADTATAAKNIISLDDPSHAAIGSTLAAELYGLTILKEDVQDANHNTTRFLILSREGHVAEFNKNKDYITSFIFEIRNMPAALYKAMGGFATNNINIVKLESYVGKKFQTAQFYTDVMGHPEDRPLQLAMEELGFFTKKVTLLGTYEAHKYRQEK